MRALMLTLALFPVALAISAPVPKPRPVPPPSLVGTWEVSGQGGGVQWVGRMRFDRDGAYHHQTFLGAVYVGGWLLAGDGSLVVREQFVQADGTLGGEMCWSIDAPAWDVKEKRWSGTGSGDYGTVGSWRLAAPAKARP